jgi:superfamily II DNA helicase RecQ
MCALPQPRVMSDIQRNLKLNTPFVVRTTFNRPNLFYAVQKSSGDWTRDLTRSIFGAAEDKAGAGGSSSSSSSSAKSSVGVASGSCIVYTIRKDDTEPVVQHLNRIGVMYVRSLPSARACVCPCVTQWVVVML